MSTTKSATTPAVAAPPAPAGGTALARNEPAKPMNFPALLEKSRPEIGKILPDGMDLDRVMRVALTAFRMNPDIQRCTPVSILSAVMKACELGLEPGGALKHAYLIPYRDECTFQLSYFGYLELARRSGEFRVIEARLVHANDVFEYGYTPDLEFNHRPNLITPGAEVGAYAYAKLVNGETLVEWMPRVELEKVEKLPKAGPVWKLWWGEMAKKTVLKRFLKKQRLSVTLAEALEREDAGAQGGSPQTVARDPSLSRSAALAGRLNPPAVAAPPEPEDEDQSLGTCDEAEAPAPAGREPGEEG
jgi:recombination protein RecT